MDWQLTWQVSVLVLSSWMSTYFGAKAVSAYVRRRRLISLVLSLHDSLKHISEERGPGAVPSLDCHVPGAFVRRLFFSLECGMATPSEVADDIATYVLSHAKGAALISSQVCGDSDGDLPIRGAS